MESRAFLLPETGLVPGSDDDKLFLTQNEPWLLQHLDDLRVNFALQTWQNRDIPAELMSMHRLKEGASTELRNLVEQALRQLRSLSTTAGQQSCLTATTGGNSKGKGKAREAFGDDQAGADTLHVPSSSTRHDRTTSIDTTGSSSVKSSLSSWREGSAVSMTSLESMDNDAPHDKQMQPSNSPTSTAAPQVKRKWLRGKVFGGSTISSSEESRSTMAANTASHVETGGHGIGSKLTSRVNRLMDRTKAIGIRPSVPNVPYSPAGADSQTTYECASCMEDIPGEQSTILGCTHSYCSECFGQMIVTAAKTEAQWPPRCCLTAIPRDLIIKSISPAQLKVFHEKETEYGVKVENRWYCTNVPKCGKFFIPTSVGPDSVQCTHCRHSMCPTCRGKPHKKNQTCQQDLNLQATLEHATSEGWRSCAKCHSIIEYTTGCNHMTCTCGYEFCYACNKKWRTCECTYTDLEAYVREHRNGASSSTAGANANRRLRPVNIIRLGDTRPVARRLAEAAEQRRQRQEELVERQRRELREREEQAELEEALRAIAEQQQREMEERRRQEEEEARAIEQRRTREIEKFAEAFRLSVDHLCTPASEAIRTRHWTSLEEIRTIAPTIGPSIKAIEKETEEELKVRKRLQKLDMIELRERHQTELNSYEHRYDRLIQLAGDLQTRNASKPADQHFVSDMYERVNVYTDALKEAQASEVKYLAASHARALRRAAQAQQSRICAVLEQVGVQWADHTRVDRTLEQFYTHAVEQKIDGICVEAIADLKWYQTMKGLMSTLCADRIAHLLSSGADAPALDGLDQPEKEELDPHLQDILPRETLELLT